MARKYVPIGEVKENTGQIKGLPPNPRSISKEKFKQLVDSLKGFTLMHELRPLVVNEQMVVLGGNMRLRAFKKAGYKEVPVDVVDWPVEKQAEFIIKDNTNYGEWMPEGLNLPEKKLADWGLSLGDTLAPADPVYQAPEPEPPTEPLTVESPEAEDKPPHEPSLTLLIDFNIERYDEVRKAVETLKKDEYDFEDMILTLFQNTLNEQEEPTQA